MISARIQGGGPRRLVMLDGVEIGVIHRMARVDETGRGRRLYYWVAVRADGTEVHRNGSRVQMRAATHWAGATCVALLLGRVRS